MSNDESTPTKAQLRALAAKAGVLPHEIMDDPEYGLLISPAGVQKLKALGTNPYAVAAIGQMATRGARSVIRSVK